METLLILINQLLTNKNDDEEGKKIMVIKDKTRVPIIVLFKPSFAGSPIEACSKFSVDADIQPNHIYHSSIRGFSSSIEAHKLTYLSCQPHILRIEKDHKVSIHPSATLAPALDEKLTAAARLSTTQLKKMSTDIKRKKKKKRKKEKEEKNITNQQSNQQSALWNISSVRRQFFLKPSSSSKLSQGQLTKVHLYIMDTEVTKDHPDLPIISPENRHDFLAASVDNKEDGRKRIKESGSNKKNKDSGGSSGHSSHVTGIACSLGVNDKGLIGIATLPTLPSQDKQIIQLHSIKVLDDDGDGSLSVALAAVEWLTTEKMRNVDRSMVVNLSLGFNSKTTEYNALDEAIERAISVGILFVIAAGNDGLDAKYFSPAHVRRAITVGSWQKGQEELKSSTNHLKDRKKKDDSKNEKKKQKKTEKLEIIPIKRVARDIIAFSDNKLDNKEEGKVEGKNNINFIPLNDEDKNRETMTTENFNNNSNYHYNSSSFNPPNYSSNFPPSFSSNSFSNPSSNISLDPFPQEVKNIEINNQESNNQESNNQEINNLTKGGVWGALVPQYNWGDTIDILAPGVDILSTWLDGKYKLQSGTSMSAPHVSAAACLYLFLYPEATPDDVKYFLLSVGKKGVLSLSGDGSDGTPNLVLNLPDEFISAVEQKLKVYFSN